MLKNSIILLFTAVLFYGCSGSKDLSQMTPDERYEYALNLYQKGDYIEAILEFESLITQYPAQHFADDARFYLGYSRFNRSEYLLAAFEFSRLINLHLTSEYVPLSQYMLAESYYQLSPHYSLDQRYTEKAIEEFQAFVDNFPTDEIYGPLATGKINELTEKLALKLFNSAEIYEKMEYYSAAVKYFDLVKERYHDTRFAPLSSFRKINILQSRGRLTEALLESDFFLNTYKNHPQFNAVQVIRDNLENQIATR
ncbi:MAG: outer membrane protein assembly factor BamD [Ignavibacteriaceae bacterium]|nr:outer membrane protein assembly factor BamD [Ignavibacteriaceae bacterium]